jgi:type II secretory pathway pseudopilin PulG
MYSKYSPVDALRRRSSNFAACLVLLCMSALCVGGCSGAQEQRDEQPAEQKQTSFQPGTIFEAYAGWMPADTVAVAVGDPNVLWKLVQDAFPPADRGGDAHFDALRQDLSQLVARRLGFDPTLADAIIIAGGQRWQVVVLEGEFGSNLEKNKSFEANGYTAYRFDLPGEGLSDVPVKGVWAVPLEEPAGMAFFLDKESFAAASAARTGQADGLAGTAKLTAYKQLFRATDGRRAVVASHLDASYQRMLSAQLPFPSPQAAVISLGDDLRAEVRGEKKALDGMQVLVENQYGKAKSMVRGTYQQRQNLGAAEAAAAIVAYHLDQSYVDAFRMERGEGVLNVNTALPRGPGAMMIGGLAAIAIPAFIKYIKRSKASEAPAILNRLERLALEYYMTPGDDGSCKFPPTANPVPAGAPCCEGVGPARGAKWVHPPQTWNQEGWQALDFQVTDPSYFAYQMVNKSGEDGVDRLVLRAFSDFDPGGPRHTVEVHIEGQRLDNGVCRATAAPAITLDEFQ